mgnify:CR=1 FL=1
MSEIAIRAQNVSKIYSQGLFRKKYKLVLDNINLEVKKGDRLVIIGESGMGKTTLARILSNLDVPSFGEVYWFGTSLKDVNGNEYKHLRKKVQYVHQDPYASLHPSKTIFKIIADPLKKCQGLTGRKLEEKVYELLEMVGLTPPDYFFNKYPHHLSGGGRQRLAIARALTAQPEILIADEPISMIDMSLRAAIIKLLKDLNDKHNITVILILHDIGAARYFTYEKGEIAVLYGGRIVEKGSSEEVITRPIHPYTKVLISSSPIADPELAKNREIEQLRSYDPPVRLPETKNCPFSHACNYFVDKCLSVTPELEKVNTNHYVACHVFKD